MPKVEGLFLTPDELIERWQGEVKIATLATWRSKGLGPPYTKIGGRVLYRRIAVELYETRNTRGARVIATMILALELMPEILSFI